MEIEPESKDISTDKIRMLEGHTSNVFFFIFLFTRLSHVNGLPLKINSFQGTFRSSYLLLALEIPLFVCGLFNPLRIRMWTLQSLVLFFLIQSKSTAITRLSILIGAYSFASRWTLVRWRDDRFFQLRRRGGTVVLQRHETHHAGPLPAPCIQCIFLSWQLTCARYRRASFFLCVFPLPWKASPPCLSSLWG